VYTVTLVNLQLLAFRNNAVMLPKLICVQLLAVTMTLESAEYSVGFFFFFRMNSRNEEIKKNCGI